MPTRFPDFDEWFDKNIASSVSPDQRQPVSDPLREPSIGTVPRVSLSDLYSPKADPPAVVDFDEWYDRNVANPRPPVEQKAFNAEPSPVQENYTTKSPTATKIQAADAFASELKKPAFQPKTELSTPADYPKKPAFAPKMELSTPASGYPAVESDMNDIADQIQSAMINPADDKEKFTALQSVKAATAMAAYLALSALRGATGIFLDPLDRLVENIEHLSPVSLGYRAYKQGPGKAGKTLFEDLSGTKAPRYNTKKLIDDAIEYWRAKAPDLMEIPEFTIGKDESGQWRLQELPPTAVRDIMGSTSHGAGFILGPVGVAGKAARLITETPAMIAAARPFYRSIMNGMITGLLVSEGKPAETLRNMALFGIFEPIAYAIGKIPNAPKTIKNSTLWRKYTIKERGLILQSLDDVIQKNPNMTEAEILRKWNNPKWREEALSRRGVVEEPISQEPLEPKKHETSPPSPKPTVRPDPEAPMAKTFTEALRKERTESPLASLSAKEKEIKARAEQPMPTSGQSVTDAANTPKKAEARIRSEENAARMDAARMAEAELEAQKAETEAAVIEMASEKAMEDTGQMPEPSLEQTEISDTGTEPSVVPPAVSPEITVPDTPETKAVEEPEVPSVLPDIPAFDQTDFVPKKPPGDIVEILKRDDAPQVVTKMFENTLTSGNGSGTLIAYGLAFDGFTHPDIDNVIQTAHDYFSAIAASPEGKADGRYIQVASAAREAGEMIRFLRDGEQNSASHNFDLLVRSSEDQILQQFRTAIKKAKEQYEKTQAIPSDDTGAIRPVESAGQDDIRRTGPPEEGQEEVRTGEITPAETTPMQPPIPAPEKKPVVEQTERTVSHPAAPSDRIFTPDIGRSASGEAAQGTPEYVTVSPDSPEAKSEEAAYSLKDIEAGPEGTELTLSDIQAGFPGQAVGLFADGSGRIWVRVKGGTGFTIQFMDQIDDKTFRVGAETGTFGDGDEIIDGMYHDFTISLSRWFANKKTFDHEKVHALEHAGIINQGDIRVLRTYIRQLDANGKWGKTREGHTVGGREDRAEWIASEIRDFVEKDNPKNFKGILRKILQKVKDWFDWLVNLFKRTPRGIARDIRTGKIYEKHAKRMAEQPYLYSMGERHYGESLAPASGPWPSKGAPLWRSQMMDYLQGPKGLPKQGDPHALAGMIEKWAEKGHFKPQELKESKLIDWLRARPDKRKPNYKPVTRRQILEYLKDKHAWVKEVVYGDPNPLEAMRKLPVAMRGPVLPFDDLTTTEAPMETKAVGIAAQRTVTDNVHGFTIYSMIDDMGEDLNIDLYEPSPYPGKEPILVGEFETYDDAVAAAIDKHIFDTEQTAPIKYKDLYTLPGYEEGTQREIVLWSDAAEKLIYPDTAHYVEGYGGMRQIAWARTGIHAAADGTRYLMANEIQSKRHQEARDIRKRKIQSLVKEGLTQKEAMAAVPVTYAYDQGKVPDAPFKSTKVWSLLTLKRLVSHAVRNRLDGVAWPDGNIIADWTGSRQKVKRIYYTHLGEGLYEVYIEDDNGNPIVLGDNRAIASLSEAEIEKRFGKDILGQLQGRKGVPARDSVLQMARYIETEGVSLGGEELVNFYNEMLPRIANKFFSTASWGRAKVERRKTENKEDIHYLKITPEMKDRVLTEGMPLFSSRQVAPIWHSQMQNVLSQKLPGKGTGKSFLQTIQSLVNKGDIKAEEYEWSDLDEFLKGKESVTKQEVLGYLDANNVRVEEVEKGADEKDIKYDLRWEESSPDNYQTIGPDGSLWEIKVISKGEDTTEYEIFKDGTRRGGGFDSTFDLQYEKDAIAEQIDIEVNPHRYRSPLFETLGISDTKFYQHQTPGGENYKELLLTLPKLPPIKSFDVKKHDDGKWYIYQPNGEISDGYDDRSRAKRIADIAQKTMVQAGIMTQRYESLHWEEPNVLAHIRFNERTGPNGERILFIEEVQSDWHQKGRKKGYRGETYGVSLRSVGVMDSTIFDSLESAEEYISQRIKRSKESEYEKTYKRDDFDIIPTPKIGSVPNAPFKKTWPILAMKRMVRYAAKNGFDSIAWTPGEVQADRYDLSKQVDFISWNTSGNKSYITIGGVKGVSNQDIEISVDKETGIVGTTDFGGEQFTGKHLSDVVGKDISENILSNESGRLEEEGLKVGGEGMKGFYDKILPAEVNKFFNKAKWGKAKVGEIAIPGEETHTGYELIDVHSLPITPEMREKALTEGMPLFSRTRNWRVPTFKDAAQAKAFGKVLRPAQMDKMSEAFGEKMDKADALRAKGKNDEAAEAVRQARLIRTAMEAADMNIPQRALIQVQKDDIHAKISKIGAPMRKLADLYDDYVGHPVWNFLSTDVPVWMGERYRLIDKINKEFILDYRKDPDYIALRDETRQKILQHQELAKELANRIATFDRAEQVRFTQVIEGSITATPQRYKTATEVIERFQDLEKELQKLGILGPDNFLRQFTRKEIAILLNKIKDPHTGIDAKIDKAKKRLEPVVKYRRTVKGISEDIAEDVVTDTASGSKESYETRVSKAVAANEDRVKEALQNRGYASGEVSTMIERIKKSVIENQPTGREQKNIKEIRETVTRTISKTIHAETEKIRTYSPGLMAKARNQIVSEIKDLVNERRAILDRIHKHYKNSGKHYLRRMSAMIETEKKFMAQTRRYLTQPRLKKGYTIQRKDLTPAYEKYLQMVQEAPARVYKGLSDEYHDRFLMEMFIDISKNRDWAITPKALENLQKVKNREHLSKKYENFKPLPESEKLGPLSGALVSPYMWDDLNQAVKVKSDMEKALDEILRMWKTGKVVFNPATQVRNMFSNTILAFMDGLSPFRVDIYARAAHDLLNKTGYYLEAKPTGLLGTEWAGHEIKKFLTQTESVKQERSIFSAIKNMLARGLDFPGNIYQGSEQYFKLALFTYHRSTGKSIKQSAKRAEGALFNYLKIPRAIRWAKYWYSPFITFSYKAIPYTAQTTVRRPWKMIVLAMLMLGVEEWTRRKFGETEEDVAREKRVLPDYMQNHVLPGVRGHMRVPYKDRHNRSKYLDLTFILPWGDVAESWGQTRVVGRPFMPGHPLYVFAGEIGFNKIFFTGQDLTLPTDTDTKYWAKIAKQLWRHAAPSLAGSYSYNKLMSAWKGELDWALRDRSLGEVMFDVFLGLKLRSIDYREEYFHRMVEKQGDMREISKEFNREYFKIIRSGGSADEIREKTLALYKKHGEKVDKIIDEMWKMEHGE